MLSSLMLVHRDLRAYARPQQCSRGALWRGGHPPTPFCQSRSTAGPAHMRASPGGPSSRCGSTRPARPPPRPSCPVPQIISDLGHAKVGRSAQTEASQKMVRPQRDPFSSGSQVPARLYMWETPQLLLHCGSRYCSCSWLVKLPPHKSKCMYSCKTYVPSTMIALWK